MAVSTAELLGPRRKQYVLATPKHKRSRSEAWDYLLNHPPIIKVDGWFWVPVRRHDYYALRKCHSDTHWRWAVMKWELLEESFFKDKMARELMEQLAKTVQE